MQQCQLYPLQEFPELRLTSCNRWYVGAVFPPCECNNYKGLNCERFVFVMDKLMVVITFYFFHLFLCMVPEALEGILAGSANQLTT